MSDEAVRPEDSLIPLARRVSGKPKGNRAVSRDWVEGDRLADIHRMAVDLEQEVQRLGKKVDALLRERFVDMADLDPLYRVRAGRFPIHSQHEEDGLLLALLRELGPSPRYFVEIGCGTNGGNSGFLAELGWDGLMVDEAAHCVEAVRERYAHTRVQAVEWSVTPGNVNTLLGQHEVPHDITFLSIDVDSFDYWVLRELSAARPRIIMIEYNSVFGPEASVTIPFDLDFDRRRLTGLRRLYFGASLSALDRAARERGYDLFDCDSSGANAIFLRADVAPHLPRRSPGEAFRFMPKHRRSLDKMGHDAVEFFHSEGLPLEWV